MQEMGVHRRWRFAGPSLTDERVAALSRQLGVDPLIGLLLVNRGVATAVDAQRFLKPKLTDLHDPTLLPGIVPAARRIAQAVRDRQPIVIYGDYDVDGITAAAILWHTLRQAGTPSELLTIHVPHRLDEGYGLNEEAIRRLATSGGASGSASGGGRTPLIISVDCGITAVAPAKVARECGADLIITDHHAFDPDHLPDACCLVHPRLRMCDVRSSMSDVEQIADRRSQIAHPPEYPFGDLCGAGVALKLAWQVAREHCNNDSLPTPFKYLLYELISLAALGTVADVVPLRDENRVMTCHGLEQIRRTRFVGVNALIDAAGLRDESEKIDAYHVGFVLGPRLNACGRMGHAREAVRLLTDADADESAELAAFLTRQNDRRRATERETVDRAREMIVAEGADAEDRRAIVVGAEGWHPGVAGVVASRVAGMFGRPAVVLCYDNGIAQGSARSVPGVSIHDALCACRAHLEKFGGHEMAAGLRLPTAGVDRFREALVEHVNRQLAPEDLTPTITIDAEVDAAQCTTELFEQIDRLKPFGCGNAAPRLLLRGVELDRPARRIGAEGRHLSLMLRQGRRVLRAVRFGDGDMADQLPAGVCLDVVFEPRISHWQGRRYADLHVADLKRLCPAD